MGLTAKQIQELLAGDKGTGRSKASGWYFTIGERNEDGTQGLQMNFGKPKADEVGRYEGKVGSVRRSRRGVATRMPNGSRKFNPGLLNEDLTSAVVAYKV